MKLALSAVKMCQAGEGQISRWNCPEGDSCRQPSRMNPLAILYSKCLWSRLLIFHGTPREIGEMTWHSTERDIHLFNDNVIV